MSWNLTHWLQSPVCRVMFAGFESDTYRLQEAGWQISARRSMYNDSIQLALHHEKANLYALTNNVDVNYFLLRPDTDWSKHLIFSISCVSSKMMIRSVNETKSFFDGFQPIDARPNWASIEEFDLASLNIFKPIGKMQEIVVGPQTVQEALDYVLKLQDPEQKLILENRRKEALRERVRENLSDVNGKSSYNICAQIVTVA